MPQFTFYTVPVEAKSMTFSQLFVDCFGQMKSYISDMESPPLLPGPLNISLGIAMPPEFERPERKRPELRQPTSDVPEPMYLGDLAKLFCGPVLIMEQGKKDGVPVVILRGCPVCVKEFANPSASDVVRVIQMSKMYDRAGWEIARIGDPEREIWYPDILCEELIFDMDDLTTTYSTGREPELSRRRTQFVLSVALHYFNIAPDNYEFNDVVTEIFRMTTPELYYDS